MEQTQSGVLSCITHMTILSIVIRVMKVGHPTSQTSVTSSCPFGDCACTLVHGQKECQVYQFEPFQDKSRTDIAQFSDCFQLLCLEVVIIQARRWNCVQLFRLFVCQFTIPVYALFRTSYHVVGPRDSFCMKFLPSWYFSVAIAEIRDSNISLHIDWQCLRSVYIHVECIPNIHDREMMLVRQGPQVPSISSTWEPLSAVFQPF